MVGHVSAPGDAPRRWSLGSWGTVDIAGVVLGFEASLHKSDRVFRPDGSGTPRTVDEALPSALVTASYRVGDFFLFAEGSYSEAGLTEAEASRIGSGPIADPIAFASYLCVPGSIGRAHAAAGIEWSLDPVSAGISALYDIEEGSGAAMLAASWAVDDAAHIGIKARLPFRSGRVSEYDFSLLSWSAGLNCEVFF
jgi:hypothetical protein